VRRNTYETVKTNPQETSLRLQSNESNVQLSVITILTPPKKKITFTICLSQCKRICERQISACAGAVAFHSVRELSLSKTILCALAR